MAGAMVLGMGIPVSAEEKESADEITIWAWDESFNIKAANVAKEMYAETNPDVKVNGTGRHRGKIKYKPCFRFL